MHFASVTAAFVAVLLISNIAAIKVVQLGSLVFDGGALLFPVAYIFGDVLTEVYGYQRTRYVIWTGFLWLLVMNVVLMLTVAAPPEASWNQAVGQDAFQKVLGLSPRIALAGLAGYFWGELVNSYILARMKVWSEGRMLWARTIGSTLVGQFIDTALFCTIAFYGVIDNSQLVNYTVVGYLYKCSVEALFTPVTYAVVGHLKKVEHSDPFDRDIDFNPFRWRVPEARS